ncbi:MAG: hypothetical protein J0H22_02120 [Actinobacteria bacterium]|nr:hypothetical protein [Actinomycetota bacterium]
MWTVVRVQGTEAADVVRTVLDRWQAGIAAHRPDQVAAVFTEDVILQGLRPYSIGRQGVFDGSVLSLNLGVLVTQGNDGWQIAHHQVSPT